MLHLLPIILGSVEYLLVTRGGETGGREEVLGAGRLWSCSCNNCAALKVTSGSFFLVFGVFGGDPAQLEMSETHTEDRVVGESLLSAVGLKTCTGMALNCSAGILICKGMEGGVYVATTWT